MASIAILIGGALANAQLSLKVLTCFRDNPRIALMPKEKDTMRR